MAERRPTILVALADHVRAEELAAYLAEHEGMLPVLRDEIPATANTGFDAIVSDDAVADPATPAVLLGARPSEEGNAAARAMLRPSAANPVIAAAVKLAIAGYRVVPPPERPSRPPVRHAMDGEIAAPAALTHREKEVLALLAEGASNKLIARRLGISMHTAKFHVAAILQKLGAVNRTDAIAIAMRDGLVLL